MQQLFVVIDFSLVHSRVVNKSQVVVSNDTVYRTITAAFAKVCSTEKWRSPLHLPIFCRRNCRNAFKFAFHSCVKSPARTEPSGEKNNDERGTGFSLDCSMSSCT